MYLYRALRTLLYNNVKTVSTTLLQLRFTTLFSDFSIINLDFAKKGAHKMEIKRCTYNALA